MPYQEHPSCNTPRNLRRKIWRYMDFTKFVSMLEDKTLFFPNLSTLSDPLEGFLTKPTVEKFREIPAGLTTEEAAKRRAIGEHNLKVMRMGRSLLYISSWHMSNHESVAMWELYVKSGEGIAIQSTVGRMISSVANFTENVYIGEVKYVDYEKQEIPWNNTFFLAVHKRKSFEYERELRAIVMSPENLPGKSVPVDLDPLIYRVYVAPNSPIWIHDLVKKMLIKYDLKKDVIHSGLDQNPMY